MNTEELVITIKVDDKDASSKLDTLKSRIEEIESISRGKGFQHLSEVASALTKLARATDDMGASAKHLKELGDAANVFSQRVKNIKTGELRDAASAIDSFKGAIGRLNESASNGTININTANASAIVKTSDVVKMLAGEFKTAFKWGAKVTQLPFKMLFVPLEGAMARVQSLAGAFTGLLSKIGRVALMRGIRGAIRMVTKAIKEGVGAVYEWADAVGDSFVGTMNSISTSLTYFRNSIGAAISPILDAFAPVLDVIVDKCVAVINVFNQLIATLTGATTWRRAEKVATSYGDAASNAAKNTGKANDAAKELRRTLLGFDEINRLDAPDKSSSSSGSGGGGGTGASESGVLTFTRQPISSSVEDFAQKLRDAWKKADFTEIGNTIGEKVGGALLSVPWEKKIQPTAAKVATSFGTLLTGMFDYTGSGGKAMWDGIAYTIYGAINTALIARSSFFGSVNWNGIGQGIGAALAKVVYNIRWDEVRKNLSAFPNAVIDAVTGFCTQMSPADFHQAGIKVGNAVAGALIDIKWKDLFQNGFKMADRLLQALNGVFEGFGKNWEQIKTGILDGIKSVSPEQWAKLGTDIGKLIFNVGDFVANVVDLLISSLKEGKWGDLLNGIKKGIDDGITKEYGGWGGAAIKLAGWIGDNIGALNIAFAFILGSIALKFTKALILVKLLKTALPGLAGAGAAGTAGASTLGGFLSAIPIVAGLSLFLGGMKISASEHLQDDLNRKLVKTMKGVFMSGIGGALTGFGLASKIGMTGMAAGAWGFAIATGITLSFSALTSMADDLKSGDGVAFAEELVGAIVGSALGAAIGLTVGPAGAFVGGLIGFGIGAKLHIFFEKLDFGYEGITGNAWTDWYEGSLLQGIVNGLGLGADTVYAADAPQSSQSQSSSQVLKFQVAPDVSASSDWWKELNTTWKGLMSVHKAERFHVAGVVNEAQEWWTQARTFWSDKVTPGTTKAARFHVTGVVNESTEWWTQVRTFWSNKVGSGQKASRFQVAGVVNDASTWWDQTRTFWNNYTKGSKLYVSVGISGAYNAFVNAWNSMQRNFNNNILTAYVQVKRTGGGSSKATYTADGGIYKNGYWQDITRYATGGTPMSGQMFIAREAGPEMVGTLNGSTAVVNNDQIVNSIADGVFRAASAALGNGQREPVNDIVIRIDSETLYRVVKKGERKASGRYGTAVAIG